MIYTVSKDRNDGVGYALAEKLNVKYPIVFVSLQEELNFNEEVLSLKGKPYILIDFTELGYDWDRNFGHHFGVNTDRFPNQYKLETWKVFDDFVRENPPVLTLCRELLMNDVTATTLPICYPCFLPPHPIQSYEQFNNRPFETIFSWGLSHEYRKTLHGLIWQMAGKYGYSVCDNLYYINGFLQHEGSNKKWLTLNVPHYARIPMEEFIKINGMAKISVSIAGAGRNCFRHTESPVNSAMLLWEDNLAWDYKWEDGVNCIKCTQGSEINTIIEYLNKPELLYEIYKKGVETVDFYRFENYIPFLERQINNA